MNRMLHCIFRVALFIVATEIMSAQGNIEGRVGLSYESGGIADAEVYLLLLKDGERALDDQMNVLQKNAEKKAVSASDGSFAINNIQAGTYRITAVKLGYPKIGKLIAVENGKTTTLSINLELPPKRIQEVTVFGAARREQKLTEAPASISVVSQEDIKKANSHGLIGKALEGIQGIDVAQSGMNDFSINARGFNNSINRRMLVLIDGRDPSTPLLNLIEWNSFQTDMADIKSIEAVRGPGSALYGSNAYNGVVNITTFSPRDVLGTRISVTGGEYETFRANARYAAAVNDHISFKINGGYSTQLQSWVRSRDISNGGSLEYAGLAPDVAGQRNLKGELLNSNVDSLLNAHKNAFNYFGTARVDYNFADDERVLAEIGYSQYGNEYFVNQTGRILIPDVEKPFARLAYNSPRWNIQGHWYRRNTPEPQLVLNARATSAERSDVAVLDAQWNDTFFDNSLKVILGASHEYQHVNTTIVSALPLLSPDNLYNNFSGVYGQAEYSLTKTIEIVGALRYDRSTFFEDQFSPKLAVVFTPESGHSIRATLNRSFLRPSYGDLYRRSPAGAPLNVSRIDSLVGATTGVSPLNLGVLSQWNLGNPLVKPETSMSYEVGYKGVLSKELFITADVYYNRRSNFISNPLGGLAPETYSPLTYGNSAADSMFTAELQKLTNNQTIAINRLATDPTSGQAALIIAPKNIGLVNEFGVELGANYYFSNELLFTANYAWLGTTVVENTVSVSKILPNTSPHRITFGASYTEPNGWDAGIQVRHVQGFQWIAGLFEGNVPSYTVVNINAGYYFMPTLRLGVNVFNALDYRHYQIFGGTILQRYATATLSYQL